jgi:hypothetical protein
LLVHAVCNRLRGRAGSADPLPLGLFMTVLEKSLDIYEAHG